MQSSRREKYFQQEEVCIRGKNVAALDDYMVQVLKHGIPKDTFTAIYKDVNRFGVRCTTDLDDLNERANYPENYPKLVPINGWGRRVDEIRVCHEWTQLHRVAAEEGLISIGYQKDLGIYNRLHQYLKCYYFSPVSGFITCPLAMTDGAARLVEQLRIERAKVEATGKPYSYPPLLDAIYEHVTSRDPDQFWTSGQWMTEKAGGSDVRQTETFAKQIEGNVYSLTGYKYFTSATTANVTFTLAYIEGQKELSMFVLRIRDDNGKLNNMMIHRLKDKLGTKTVPTAEIELLGTRAELVGEAGKGVRTIANLFNITRIWTVMGSAGLMTRLLAYVRDYARRRIAFKKSLTELPAHILTVSRLEIYSRAVTQLFVKVTLLLGEDERSNDNTNSSHLLRLLTPICKLFCCKLVTEFIQEALESFGSPGYMEDTGLPSYMRDAQVNTIWEGTSNILSLDLLRAIAKEKSLPYFVTDVKNRIAKNGIKSLDSWCQQIKTNLDSIPTYLSVEPSRLEFYARDLAVSMARIYAASLLIQHANSTGLEEDAYTVNYWCSESPANRKQDDVVRALAKL